MTHPPTDGLWALVLAGGDGTRLRELTRLISGAPIPKQYCRILGDRSLLEATLARVAFVMVLRLRRMLELLHQVRPAGTSRLARLLDDPDALVAAYPSIAAWNFSRDFLARIPEHLAVVRAADVGWSDWGTPEAIEHTLAAMGVLRPWQVPLRAAG